MIFLRCCIFVSGRLSYLQKLLTDELMKDFETRFRLMRGSFKKEYDFRKELRAVRKNNLGNPTKIVGLIKNASPHPRNTAQGSHRSPPTTPSRASSATEYSATP